MELFFLCGVIIFALIVAYSLSLLFSTKRPNASASNLPPGKFGLPYVGESLQFLSTSRNGHPEKFIYDRMTKYTTKIFKTSILGEPTVVLCGSAGNKFLFTSENKYVQAWWPRSVDKIFPNPTNSAVTDESRKMRKLLPDFLKPQALQRYIGIMDNIAQRHFASNWEGKQEITVYPLAQRYTFWLACKLFVSIDDPQHIKKYADAFDLVTSGIISIPIDFPGTAFNRGIKASSYIRKELLSIIKQRKTDLAENRASPNQDILSHMLLTSNEDGEYMSEFDIASKILGLIVGGEGTATSVITFIVKYLADHPGIYDRVLKEQLEIANSKKPGEFINWVDVQKMKYSWNVACEVMRLVPPVLGTFREAIEDFSFEGYTIPKGWKIYYSTRFNHKNPEYFPEPEKFDPSRFEGSGPAPYTFIPFGGGPRICPGKEYARMEILVFLHNIIKRFKWKLLIPDERIIMDPIPRPAKGLPIGLVAH